MDELKELLGEELFNTVSEKLGDKKVFLHGENDQVVISNNGEWIPKSKFDALNDEKKSYKEQADNYSKELGKLKKLAEGNEELQSEIEKLKTTIKDNETSLDKVRTETVKKYALKDALRDAQAKHPDLLLPMFKLEELELDGEKIKDFDKKLEPIKEQYKDLFGEVRRQGQSPVKGNPPSGGLTKEQYEANKHDAKWVESNLDKIKDAMKNNLL